MESICEDSDIVAANIKVCFYGLIFNSSNNNNNDNLIIIIIIIYLYSAISVTIH